MLEVLRKMMSAIAMMAESLKDSLIISLMPGNSHPLRLPRHGAVERLDAAARIVVDVGEAVRAHQALLVEAVRGAGRHQHLGAEVVIGERLAGEPGNPPVVARD